MVFWFAFGRTYYEKKKKVLVISKTFGNSDFCLEFAICVRSQEQFIQTVKGQNKFWKHFGTIKMRIGNNNWDVETYRNK